MLNIFIATIFESFFYFLAYTLCLQTLSVSNNIIERPVFSSLVFNFLEEKCLKNFRFVVFAIFAAIIIEKIKQ